MNNNPRFTRKRLSQIIAAGLLTGLGASASANDFSISHNGTDNQFLITNGSNFSQSASVNSSGVVTLINNVPLTSSFATPDFSFTLVNNVAETDTTYRFRVGVIIDDDNSNRRMEAVLDQLDLVVDGETVTGSIPAQPLRVYGRAGSVNLDATLQNDATNGPITISGGEVTFSGSRLVERLENSALLENILGEFDTGDGDYSYSIVIVQTNTVTPAADFGIIDGGDFASFGAADYDGDFELADASADDFTGSAFKVSGTFNTAAVSTGGGDTGGGTTDPVDEDEEGTEDVVDDAELEQQEQEADELTEAVDAELESGTVSETTVTNTTNLATESATTTTNITNAISSGTTVSTSNILGALSAGSKTSSTAGKVAGATTDATAQETLKTQNTTILNNSATMLNSLSERNATLTTEESTAMRTASTNLLSTAGSLATTTSTTEDLQNIAAQTNSILAAQANLGVAADETLVESVRNVSVQIATNLIRQAITAGGGSGDDITDDEIREQLTSNSALLDEVIENTLQVPPSIVVTNEQRDQRINDAAPNLPTQASERARQATQKFVNPNNVTIGGVNVLSILSSFLAGPTTATLLDDSGRVMNVIALEAGQTEITVDDATGAVTIKVPGETYAGMIVSVRSVPDTVPEGLRFRTDGRVSVITNGTAVDIAPTAVSVLGFIQAVEEAGYPFTQNDNASFALDLGGNQTFSGAFAYDNLVDENLDTACGAVGIVEPTGPVNAASYSFGIQCASGVVQQVVPFAYNTDFYRTIRGAQLTAVTDRNTGIINVNGVGMFKPSFFITQPTAAELEFHTGAKDSRGIALQATDANNDGIVDYKVISENSVQIMYGVN